MAGLTLTVSQLGNYVQRSFQSDPLLRDLTVSGEISNLKAYGGGILFFTLKDEQAAVACVMYAEYAEALSVMPFDGMRVLARGSVSLYVKGGRYQLSVRDLRTQGVGPLYEQLQRRKAALAREGLFDEECKKPIPAIPDTVGVVTSPTGAVIRDILQVSLRRNPKARILLCPVRVQGMGADEEIVRAIDTLDRTERVSTIIIARGGGSIEDLWTFNEEKVVRAVAACRTPVVSAVGHETDVTLCDLAADLRVPTPSAAAECTVPQLVDLQRAVLDAGNSLREAMADRLREAAARLDGAKGGLKAVHPSRRLDAESRRLEQALARMKQEIRRRFEHAGSGLAGAVRELALVSPYAVLQRGYAIAEKDGVPVVSAAQIAPGDQILLRFGKGKAVARIIETEGGEDSGSQKKQTAVL
ncbi:MAG: exodeoxyribonuclease VII large subunit [Clostridia bacterium]|nr:exodeoxyribonuclease VII large subunit [Clostridia bacterium]